MIKVELSKDVKAIIMIKTKILENNMCGIYFLKHNNIVVYVGQSKNIRKRIKEHLGEKTKVFNDFTFILCPPNLLNETETAYIYKHDPLFNRKDSLTEGMDIKCYCKKNNIDFFYEEKTKTHVQVKVSAKNKLQEIRDREGYASIEIVVDKLLKKIGNKSL